MIYKLHKDQCLLYFIVSIHNYIYIYIYIFYIRFHKSVKFYKSIRLESYGHLQLRLQRPPCGGRPSSGGRPGRPWPRSLPRTFFFGRISGGCRKICPTSRNNTIWYSIWFISIIILYMYHIYIYISCSIFYSTISIYIFRSRHIELSKYIYIYIYHDIPYIMVYHTWW